MKGRIFEHGLRLWNQPWTRDWCGPSPFARVLQDTPTASWPASIENAVASAFVWDLESRASNEVPIEWYTHEQYTNMLYPQSKKPPSRYLLKARGVLPLAKFFRSCPPLLRPLRSVAEMPSVE